MKAIILAAGRGSRMGDATEGVPKCLTELGGKSLLSHLVGNLQEAGFKLGDIGIVTGYKHEEIRMGGVAYFHNPDWEKTNMFYSLTMASDWLASEACLVCYSDIYASPATLKLLKNDLGDIAIMSYTDFLNLWELRFENPLDDLETFRQEDSRLTEIGNMPKSLDEVQGQFMGLLRFTPKGWGKVLDATKAGLPKPAEKIDMTGLLQYLVTLGHDIEVLETNDLWLEVDCQNDVWVYEACFNRK